MSKAAWTKFEEKLSSQGYSFEDVKLSDEDGRKALLLELGFTSELEKAAVITEWKTRLSSSTESAASRSRSLSDSAAKASSSTESVEVQNPPAIRNSGVSQMKRPPKKVGFNAKSQAHEPEEEPPAAQDPARARRPTLEDTKKLTKMKVR